VDVAWDAEQDNKYQHILYQINLSYGLQKEPSAANATLSILILSSSENYTVHSAGACS